MDKKIVLITGAGKGIGKATVKKFLKEGFIVIATDKVWENKIENNFVYCYEMDVPIAKASIAAGADMLMMEVHPNPSTALSDAQQQLSLEEFDVFYREGNFYNIFEKRFHC